MSSETKLPAQNVLKGAEGFREVKQGIYILPAQGNALAIETDESFAREHSLHPNGEKFLMVKPGDLSEGESPQLILVQNWLEEVKRKIPTD